MSFPWEDYAQTNKATTDDSAETPPWEDYKSVEGGQSDRPKLPTLQEDLQSGRVSLIENPNIIADRKKEFEAKYPLVKGKAENGENPLLNITDEFVANLASPEIKEKVTNWISPEGEFGLWKPPEIKPDPVKETLRTLPTLVQKEEQVPFVLSPRRQAEAIKAAITTPLVEYLPDDLKREFEYSMFGNRAGKGGAAEGVLRGLGGLATSFTSPIGIATLGMGSLPRGTQKLISTAFALDMGRHTPELARQLGEEMGKNEKDRNRAKIAELITSGAANTVFAVLAGKHGLSPERIPAGKPATWTHQERVDFVRENLDRVIKAGEPFKVGEKVEIKTELPPAAKGSALSESVQSFEKNTASPDTKFGNKVSTETGLGVKSLADLEKLAELRKKYDAEARGLNRKAASLSGEAQMDAIVEAQRAGQKSQLSREAIEVATDTGSWIEAESQIGKLGERPLDWTKNPEVADWLKANAKDLGIQLPEIRVSEPTVTLYRGQDHTIPGGEFWSTDPAYAAKHGKNVQVIEVSKSVADKARADFVATGSGTKGAHILPEEISKTAKPLEAEKIPDVVQDLTPVEEITASKIERQPNQRDIFEMDDVELGKVFDRQFGKEAAIPKEGEFGRGGQYTFSDYQKFKDWMDARHAERDLEGMMLAFAEADRAFKIKYIKENMTADALKKAWISHMATGSPLPAENPPVVRTTPRPLPGGGTAPVPGGSKSPSPGGSSTPPSGARPGQPPPPPRAPTSHRKFNITALVQLFRQFGNSPTMNSRLKSAYGQFINTTKGQVELKHRLLWDEKLAERVLGHEIGHFIDFVVKASGKGKNIANKLFSEVKNNIAANEQLKKDAIALSTDWRGGFSASDKYRNSPSELFADFMSAMFNNPEWVNQTYPRLFDAFQKIRDAKPAFRSAYREIETWLQSDTVSSELRAQDKKAVERTVDILTSKDDRIKASFKDRLIFDLTTIWNRAFQKEGKPREIGNRIIDKLETSYMWAAKRTAMWHDDFLKSVQPFLDKISSDPAQAHADLLSYSKAVRTIGERRASGIWIERNPNKAREILDEILKTDPGLRMKFASELQTTPNDGLYDLSAKVFREIHDRGKDYAANIARKIDELDLGVDGEAALMAFNVRGKLLNPSGLVESTALRMIEDMKASMTPDQFSALETASKNLRDLLHDVQKEMYDNGLISKKTWDELIAPNKDNYMPYAVLDYFDGKVRAGVMPQKGTAKDIADVAISTQLKVASAFAWLQKQRQVELLREAYARGGSPIPIGDVLKKASDVDRLRNENKNDNISRAVIWKDGKPHLVEFVGDNGKLIQDALTLPEFYDHIDWMHDASKLVHQGMQLYTQLSPRFLLYRNIVRGFRTAGLKVGFGEAFKQMKPENLKYNLKLAKNYADAAFGGEMLPEVRRLVELEALPPPRVAAGAVRDLPNMRELILRGSLPVFRVGRIKGDVSSKSSQISDKARKAKNVTDKIFTSYEAFEKIYNYQAARNRGLTEMEAAQIARRGGIPNPGSVGKWSSAVEILFPWTRVRMQGMRSTFDMMRDPRFQKGFAARFAVTEALPKIAKVALAVGLVSKGISLVTRKDEDADDPVISEVMKRISPYKMALDDVVPTMLFDPRTGKYHYFWEYKKGSEIPKHYEVVSIRIPSSEEGNVWGTMLYNAMISTPGVSDKLASPGQGLVENMGNWAIQNLAPAKNPLISTVSKLTDMTLRGRNPQDEFRGQPSANEELFNAGGSDRAQAITGYALNQLGGPGELGGVIAANLGLLDPRAMASLSKRLSSDTRPWTEKIPFFGTVVSHDNYGTYRDEKNAEIEDKQIRAKARLLMPPETRQLYDFYYRNMDRRDKLSDSEQAQFDIASEFVNQVWGKMTVNGRPNPDSFFSKAAHAVGQDGSSQAKKTFEKDIQQASQILVIEFEELRKKK